MTVFVKIIISQYGNNRLCMLFLQTIWLAVTDIFSMHIYASCQLQCGQHHKRVFVYLYNIGP